MSLLFTAGIAYSLITYQMFKDTRKVDNSDAEPIYVYIFAIVWIVIILSPITFLFGGL